MTMRRHFAFVTVLLIGCSVVAARPPDPSASDRPIGDGSPADSHACIADHSFGFKRDTAG